LLHPVDATSALPGPAGCGEALLEREKRPDARSISQSGLEDDHQTSRRHARVDEVVGQVRLSIGAEL
jgi:hypothetical protein